MLNRVELGNRLKKLRKNKKFSQQYVAQNLFISQAAYSLIENSQNGIVAEHIIKLSKLYEVTTDYILKGDNLLIRISPEEGFVPYIQVKAHAGYIKNLSKDLSKEDWEWYKIPGYNPTEDHRLFEVEGESMVPTIFPGDIIITQKQNKWDQILEGSLVIVVTNKSLLVKRFRKGKEPDVFIFDNNNDNDNVHEDETIAFSRDEIKEIMMVRGKISSVLNLNQMNSNGKIQSMEESIKSLKKELFSISKKSNTEKNKN